MAGLHLSASPQRALLDAMAARLDVPRIPVPDSLVPALRSTNPDLLSSRRFTPSPYLLADYLAEADGGTPAEYIVIGLAGHGLASRAFHYYLLLDGLMLFVQLQWGSAYGDPAQERNHLIRCLDEIDRIVSRRDRIGSGRQLRIVVSFLGGARAEYFEGERLLKSAKAPGNVLVEALGWLRTD